MNEDRIADFIVIGAVIAIIVLKIVDVIKIPWLWLLSPIWIPFGLGIIIMISLTIYCLVQEYIYKRRKNNERY